jgi:hypothetical protein
VVDQGVGRMKICFRELDMKAATCEKPDASRRSLFYGLIQLISI